MFLAVSAMSVSRESLQVLTPVVMRWSPDVWLLDLTPCRCYWQQQSKRQGLESEELYRRMFERAFEHEAVAVLSDSLWQAVLLLTYLKERQLTGFIVREQAMGQSLYRDVSWQSFWAAVTAWGEHAAIVRWKRFSLPSFRKNSRLMRRAIARLGLACPWEMQAVGDAAVRRRFGSHLRNIWTSTWSQDTHLNFPWHSHVFKNQPCVSRHLDTPLCDWQHMEGLLKEDLSKVARLMGEYEKVVSLGWRLTLSDLTTVKVPILFRHPHSLHKEPTHGTALLQAYYSFADVMLSQQKVFFEERHMPVLPVVAWELVVEKRLTMPKQVVDLFGQREDTFTNLLQLENRLPVALEAYDIQNDWTVEGSFRAARETHKDDFDRSLSVKAQARKRPLFIYKDTRPWRAGAHSSLWQFSERSMTKWWRSGKKRGEAAHRDYYRLFDHKKRQLWVFKDALGRWFVHGIFA